MAVSKMIGTAKKTIQFGILVFLETHEMNLRGNLQDSKCDILRIFMRTFFCFEKKFLPPLDPAIQTFWLQKIQTSRKMFPFECSAIVGSLPEKGF